MPAKQAGYKPAALSVGHHIEKSLPSGGVHIKKMSRTGLLNYRKLAFETYAPICVYCGFGIEAVLEVAHLDCNPANCSVANLVILCPTCHRMHDIDLIPTEVVVRLRDEKRKPRWAKLTKDAAAKAVATKRQNPELTRDAARKAVATRNARKAARPTGA